MRKTAAEGGHDLEGPHAPLLNAGAKRQRASLSVPVFAEIDAFKLVVIRT